MSRLFARLIFAGTLTLTLMSGCNMLPHQDYKRPAASFPEKWQEQTVTGTSVAAGEQWWKKFNDPMLEELIERALRSNNNLAAAALRVQRARLQSELTDTNRTPSVSVSANNSLNYDINNKKSTRSYGVSGAVSYEVDLWGKLARSRDAGQWEAEATEADRQSAALSLIGTLADNYWQIAYLNQSIAASRANLDNSERTLQLVRTKYDAGAVSGIDLIQAQQTISSQKAGLTQLQQQLVEARNSMAILFDQPPASRLPERSQLPDGPLPAITPGIPAHLLGRRPDLRAAELRLRESLASVDATRAGFYPAISLTGSVGTNSITLENILKNPAATLGLGLTLPFLQWNTTRLTIKVSETQYEEAVVNFRQALYKAFNDVENSLSAARLFDAEQIHLEEARLLSEKAEQLAEIRYRAGAAGVQSWLDQQDRSRSAELEVAGNRLNRLKNLMRLYQALGGDMEMPVNGVR